MKNVIRFWRTEGLSHNDFNYMEVNLIKSRKYYYIDGEGGAATFFADHPHLHFSRKKDMSVSCYGKRRIRLTENEAEFFKEIHSLSELKDALFDLQCTLDQEER